MGRVICLKCGMLLESVHRHDFVQCDCDNETFVDGGNAYTRVGGKNLDLVHVLTDDEMDSTASMLLARIKKLVEVYNFLERTTSRKRSGHNILRSAKIVHDMQVVDLDEEN